MMYYFLFLLLLVAVLSSVFIYHRKKRIICKITEMKQTEKCAFANELVSTFGYQYHCCPGIFSSSLNAWQKNLGYTFLYDYMAPRFQMVFDSLPVYFNYNNKTWLIQFWKGQYGINCGAEIGIYHADHIVKPEEYKTTLFTEITEQEMLPLSFRLFYPDNTCVEMSQTHWWLTSFDVGHFADPKKLATDNSIIFPNSDMQHAFVNGLLNAGVSANDISIHGLRVYFYFEKSPFEINTLYTRFWSKISQWSNRQFCKLYLSFTKPFEATEDRILYIYYFLPFLFRKIFRFHRFDKHCHTKKRCMTTKKAQHIFSVSNKYSSRQS